ncbi:hypothetical protein DPMN_154167 [Dreissena polymorpha]|uniref:Uncharacterized protein n=1 Tax=Dreissena polymorpha TaxID=45954 RepID=A0A9D4FMX9_DREPO|nr:hypothetical protein DPMN_154167 [Dreissena polymorpha]
MMRYVNLCVNNHLKNSIISLGDIDPSDLKPHQNHFSPIPTIFKLVRDINKTNVLTNFHDDWAKIVTSRVFTRENCHSSETSFEPMFSPTFMMIGQKLKTGPPTGAHFFQRIGTTFELNQDIIKTNILTKLHEDWA